MLMQWIQAEMGVKKEGVTGQEARHGSRGRQPGGACVTCFRCLLGEDAG